MRIEPSIGRIVWFFPPIGDGRHDDGQPFSAMIAGVNEGGSINLLVAARDGSPYGAQNVPLLQDGEDATSFDQDTAHAVWMPYQKGQAAKTEQVQATTAIDLKPVHDKLTELENGTQGKIDELAQGTQGKFEALGEWLKNTFTDFEQRLTAATSPKQAPPAAPDPVVPPAGPDAAAGATQQPA